MDLKETYNKIASDWNQDHLNDDWWYAGVDKFLSYLKPGSSILDVGCGSGHKARYLVDHGFKVKGFDFSEEMVRLSKEQVPEGQFFLWDMTKPLDETEKFDAIMMQASLLHIPKNKVNLVLDNMKKILKPESYLYVSVKKAWENQAEQGVIKEDDYGYEYERFFSFFEKEELEEYIREVGLQIVFADITSSGRTNWIQVMSRKP